MGSFPRATKAEVCEHFLEQLRRRTDLSLTPGEFDELRQHFKSLPTRYALDVNIDSLDVLNHKRLLDCARSDDGAVSFQIRTVDVLLPPGRGGPEGEVVYSPTSTRPLGSLEVCLAQSSRTDFKR